MTDGIFRSLKGKHVLVTGSSRGIGRAIAEGFAANGADVAIHCVRPCENADKTMADIKKYGTNIVAVYGNLQDGSVPKRIYEETKEAFGTVDILICNASLQIRKPWLQITDEDYELQMNINLRSTLKLSQLAATDMMKAKWGRIITVGSVQQVKPHPDMMVYSMSKMAMVNMVQSLALQLAEYNITVNNIAPGTIYTDRNRDVLKDRAYMDKVVNDIPVRFIGIPEDCTGLALLLCSDSGRYITGEDIFVDGGKHI